MDNVIFPSLPTYVGAPTLGGLLSLLVAVILPLLAALLMKSHWSAMQKGLILLALAAVKAFVEAWIAADQAHVMFNWVTTLYSVGVQFGLAVIAYFGILRGTAVQQAAINSGVKTQPGE
jgi:hypothetical protein